MQLYQKFVNPSVKKADLFQGGKYVQGNKWNKDTKNGAMHLVQVVSKFDNIVLPVQKAFMFGVGK